MKESNKKSDAVKLLNILNTCYDLEKEIENFKAKVKFKKIKNNL